MSINSTQVPEQSIVDALLQVKGIFLKTRKLRSGRADTNSARLKLYHFRLRNVLGNMRCAAVDLNVSRENRAALAKIFFASAVITQRAAGQTADGELRAEGRRCALQFAHLACCFLEGDYLPPDKQQTGPLLSAIKRRFYKP